MSKEQVRLKKFLYRDRKGSLESKTTISELSARRGKIYLDRSNAKYLYDENIKEDVEFDLKQGCREFYEDDSSESEDECGEKGGEEPGEKRDFHFPIFCKWAILQPQETLKEVYNGADVVSYRFLFRDTAETVLVHRPNRDDPPFARKCKNMQEFLTARSPNKPWARIAIKAGDVIFMVEDDTSPFLDETSEEDYDDEESDEEEEETEETEEKKDEEEQNKNERSSRAFNEMRRYLIRLQSYSGYKFEQYMTSASPQGKPEPEKKLKSKLFENVTTADLTEKGYEPIRICSFSMVDALRGDEPIELKSTFREGFLSKAHTYIHCSLANMNSCVTGIRDEDFVTRQVFERRTSDLREELKSNICGESGADEKSFSFLLDILSMTKHVLTRSKACRIVYMPKSGIVQFEGCTEKEVKKRGYGFTEEFKKRFKID